MNENQRYDQKQFAWQLKAAGLDAVNCAIYESEDLLQAACYAWFVFYLRKRGLLFAIPNGGSRVKAEALKFIATGTKAGVADFCLMKDPAETIWIEMKNRKNFIDPDQVVFKEKAESMGFSYFMANTFHQFACLMQYIFEIPDHEFNKMIK